MAGKLTIATNIVGRNIRVIRSHRRLSQEKLARSVRRDRNCIHRIEKGGTLPAEYLERIASGLGVADPFALTRSVVVHPEKIDYQ